jgi:DNA modification methylase
MIAIALCPYCGEKIYEPVCEHCDKCVGFKRRLQRIPVVENNKIGRDVCPLQLGTIERVVRLWSNPGEIVLSPFAGIGSEGYVSIQQGRKFVGCELKPLYARTAARNLARAHQRVDSQKGLF